MMIFFRNMTSSIISLLNQVPKIDLGDQLIQVLSFIMVLNLIIYIARLAFCYFEYYWSTISIYKIIK
jgi:hypothetical protein